MREFGGMILETEISPTLEAAMGGGGNNMPMILQEVEDDIWNRQKCIQSGQGCEIYISN